MIVLFFSDRNGFKRNTSGTCAVASISSISGVTSTNIRSFGVHAYRIHVTRVISFTLVNICKMINIKKIIYFKKCNWEEVAEHKLRNLSLVFLGPRRKHFTLKLTRFFSWFPASLNLLFCPVSPSIKSPFTS